jgi:hypothetical protein
MLRGARLGRRKFGHPWHPVKLTGLAKEARMLRGARLGRRKFGHPWHPVKLGG